MSEGFETYCGLLRLYDGFSAQADGAVPEWEYDHDHPGLRELSTRYRLDSVAGAGDEGARSLRLLHWLHRHVRHSNTDLDLEMNSLSLLEHAFDKGKDSGINCRMLSTTFVEACLSLGLKARSIEIHPLSPYDMDQHVVAVVWNGLASRWVMLDPMTGSHVTDPDGAMLSPWELRDRFADEAEVSCGGRVDFPGAPEEQAVALYLEYLAKSIFYLQSPARSTFGAESCAGQRWIICAPAGFDVRRREEILMAWREKWARRLGWWNDAWARYLEQRTSRMTRGVITSSIGSFAAAPGG